VRGGSPKDGETHIHPCAAPIRLCTTIAKLTHPTAVPDRAGAFNLRVNDQYRITFLMERADAYDVTCEDYH
jgi:plasmid maintenance system killer protein